MRELTLSNLVAVTPRVSASFRPDILACIQLLPSLQSHPRPSQRRGHVPLPPGLITNVDLDDVYLYVTGNTKSTLTWVGNTYVFEMERRVMAHGGEEWQLAHSFTVTRLSQLVTGLGEELTFELIPLLRQWLNRRVPILEDDQYGCYFSKSSSLVGQGGIKCDVRISTFALAFVGIAMPGTDGRIRLPDGDRYCFVKTSDLQKTRQRWHLSRSSSSRTGYTRVVSLGDNQWTQGEKDVGCNALDHPGPQG